MMNKKTINYLKKETISIFNTTLSFVAVDGIAELMNIWNGDFSRATFYALLFIAVRSVIKAIMTRVFPKIFSLREED
jgi:hypothetical protein